jgi:hypothetical protein
MKTRTCCEESFPTPSVAVASADARLERHGVSNTSCVRTRHTARNMESPDDSCED